MDAYQEFILQTAKDTIGTMKEEGKTNEAVLNYLDDLTMIFEEQGVELISEFAKLSKEYEVESSLDDLIKNATDKAKEQPLKEEKNFDLER